MRIRSVSALPAALASTTVAVLLPVCAPAQTAVTLFSDDFDAGSSGGQWTVSSHAGDYSADFGFDYGTRGIPAAPGSGGTTVGLRLMVNSTDANPAAEAVSVYPAGSGFSGDFTLSCDMWLHYNGSAGGGAGSTEFASVGIRHAGDRVVWPASGASDGLWFACSGEGGASEDYLAYRSAAKLSVAAGSFASSSLNHTDIFFQDLFAAPPFETPGAPGKQWVAVEISHRGGVVTWRLNGRLLAIRAEPPAGSGNIMLGCFDTFPSIADPVEDNFVLFDNVRVTAPDCDGNGLADQVELAAGDCNGNGRLDDCETIGPGDFDHDGDTDVDDLAAFARGMAGPGVLPGPAVLACVDVYRLAFDADSDQYLDLRDYFALQRTNSPGPFASRAADAPLGSQFIAEVAGLERTVRESRVRQEILGGNVPGFLRTFVPVTVSATIEGVPTTATYHVTPDYLCVGRDDDFVRMPMSPGIAQQIADAVDCLMPTRKMVDRIYASSAVKLAPAPISPATVDITRVTTFHRHHEGVEAQRSGHPLGLSVAGIKKDVVITPLLASNPGRVAIYGWHQLNGVPIQPLYLGHVDWYMDYSHGIRLVRSAMTVNGQPTTVQAVLADPDLHVLLSDEGIVTTPSY